MNTKSRHLSRIKDAAFKEVIFIKETGKDIDYIESKDEIPGYLDAEIKEADTLLTLGAGDVWKVGEEFLKLKAKG